MKVFIMTDLEGVAGVLDSSNWCASKGVDYPKARELLTMEINAAIEGFIEGGATEILVSDGHGGGGTIIPDLLHPKVELSCFWPEECSSAFSMNDKKFDYMAFIGQHPMAGTIGGHMSHTGNMGVVEQTYNGITVGEYGGLVFTANELGIRVIFATGCKAFCLEAENLVPGIETVAVKRGTQTTSGNHLPADVYRQHNKSAIHLHPQEARRRIKAGAKRAIDRAQKEDFGFTKEKITPPFIRIRIQRGSDKFPPRIFKQTHPTSLFEMHKEQWEEYELEINPADSELKKLVGKRTTMI